MGTPSRFVTGLNPLLLIFQHWAVELGLWYRYELQYYENGSQLRVTRSGEDDDLIDRMNYKKMPHVVKRVFQGRTHFSFRQIHQIAEYIIAKRRRYILDVSDCHNFAIDLIHKILTIPNLALLGVKLGASTLRFGKPLFLGITKILEWTGQIKDPIKQRIEGLQNFVGGLYSDNDEFRRMAVLGFESAIGLHHDDDPTLEQQDVAEQ
ncbi:hypothetical protein VTN96DRAFT_7581 [Rasamsonia emersonii]